MEGSHQVLAAGQVDPDLAADAGVHHGEQRRRNLDEGQAAQEARRREARQVPHHSATQCHDDRAAIENPSINKEAVDRSILQVGSFHSSGEADSMKAQLAFLGLQATVKSAVVDNLTWHRVQLGPFSSETKLSRAKNLLIQNDIKYMQISQP